MSLKSSLLFAKSLIFPRTEKKTAASRSIVGSIVCIALSVIPLVSVTLVSEGMFSGMTERIIALSSGHMQAVLNRNSEVVKNYDMFLSFAEGFKDFDEVSDSFVEIECDALASSLTFRTGAKIRAVERRLFSDDKEFSSLLKVTDGSLDAFLSPQGTNGKKSCVIGEKIASTLNLKAGDNIRLITTSRVQIFKISAIVSSGYQELDSLWVFIPLENAYGFLSPKTSLHSIHIKSTSSDIRHLMKLQNEIDSVYMGQIRLYRWDEVNASQFENFSSTKMMLILIMLLIVLVASVNISSALVMLVMERRKEIAIIKSLGGSTFSIAFSFILAGTFCGALGVAIGLPFGILFAVNINGIVRNTEGLVNFFYRMFSVLSSKDSIKEIHLMDPAYYLQEIPVTIEFSKIFAIVASVIVLSVLVSLIPSFKAGSERPIETLKKI